MPERDPLSVNYDGVVHQIVLRAIYAQRGKRGVQAWIASPRGEYRAVDRGGRTRHERAFTRSCYYLVWSIPMQQQKAGEGTGPAWSLKLTWGDDGQRRPGAAGKLARPVTVRVWPRSQARVRGPRWSDGEGFRSEVGNRIDD